MDQKVELKIGNHVEIAPHYDFWMQGARIWRIEDIKDGKAKCRCLNAHVRRFYWFPLEHLTKR